MANPYPNSELDLNESVQTAVFRVLRRWPWENLTQRTRNVLARLFLYGLFATLLAALLAAAAQAKTYDCVDASVPFKFDIGHRTFRPGHYQLVIVGNGVLAVRDARKHVIALVITRQIQNGGPAVETKLVFAGDKKHPRLSQIVIANRSQALEVLGEELAIRQPAPNAEVPPFMIDSLFQRQGPPGMKY